MINKPILGIFLSYNFEAVHGFTFGIDAIKSLLLMTAIVDKKINVQEAVKLSRLEVDYQVLWNERFEICIWIKRHFTPGSGYANDSLIFYLFYRSNIGVMWNGLMI